MSVCQECKRSSRIVRCTLNSNHQHHSFGKRPSIVFKSGTKHWHKNGMVHREDGPAYIHSDGRSWWYYNDIQRTEKEVKDIIAGKKKFITFEADNKKFQGGLFVLVVGVVLAIIFK